MPKRADIGTAPLGRRRETRQQRSAETQERVLRAAIDCLVESGYARLTTAAISARAGGSEGSLFRHYPSKADLVVAAVERIFADLERDHERMAARAGGKDPITAGIDTLWAVMTRPDYLATIEVYLAARTDPALHAALRPMALRHQENLMRRARELYGIEAGGDFDAVFDLLVLAVQGAATDSVALQDRVIDRARLVSLEAIARRLLAPLAAQAATGRTSTHPQRRKSK